MLFKTKAQESSSSAAPLLEIASLPLLALVGAAAALSCASLGHCHAFITHFCPDSVFSH